MDSSPARMRRPAPLERLMARLFAPLPAYQPAYRPLQTHDCTLADELVRAVGRGDRPRVQALLAQGADPQALGRGRVLALNLAVERGNVSVGRLLVQHGADPRAQDGLGRSAMGLAWLQARGGRSLDPGIAPAACGDATTLLAEWEAQFGRARAGTMFSAAYAHRHAPPWVQDRLGLDSGNGGLGHESPMASLAVLTEITSPASLLARRKARAARMIPPPPREQDPRGLPTYQGHIH